jgi:hypothetical protein
MALGPEQRMEPGEGGELIIPQIDKDSSPLCPDSIRKQHAPALDILSFEQSSGADAWHQSLVYPA